MDEIKYGWYSAKSAKLYGSCIYDTPSGETVEVTAVYTPEESYRYKWDDRVCVGEVTDCKRICISKQSRLLINIKKQNLTNGKSIQPECVDA